MSQKSFLQFLLEVREKPGMRAANSGRNLAQLLFHAKNEGFDFDGDDVSAVVSKLEIGVIADKDGEAVDGGSSLWRAMWGRLHLDYLIDHVVSRYSDDELHRLVEEGNR